MVNDKPTLRFFRWKAASFVASLGLFFSLASAGPMVLSTEAVAQGIAPSASPNPTIIRRFALSELGFRSGVTLAGLHGAREIFVPAPRDIPIAAASVQMAYSAEQAFEARRSLRLMFQDRHVHTTAIERSGVLALPLPLTDQPRGGDFLKLEFASSGALSENRCLDERVAGAFLTLPPTGTVDVVMAVAALADLRSAIAMMPADAVIVGPDRPMTAQEYAAALGIARLVTARGGKVTFERNGRGAEPPLPSASPVWSRARFVITEATTAADSPELSVVVANGEPVFRAAPGLSNRALAFLASRYAPLAEAATLRTVPIPNPATPADRLTLRQLGAPLSPQEFAERGEWFIGWSADDLPADRMAGRYAIDLRMGDDGGALPAVVSVYFNGVLVESRRASAGGLVSLRANLPGELQASRNSLRIVAQRHVAAGECRYAPQAFPAQLLPAGGLLLEPAPPGQGFVDLARALGPETTLSLPADHAERWEQSLALLASLTGRMGSPGRSFAVRFESQTGRIPSTDAPFIVVSDALAPSVDGATTVTPLRLDRGRMVVTDAEGRPRHEINDAGSSLIAQVVRSGDRRGIWIRPPRDEDFTIAEAIVLEQGDVALVNANGSASFFDILGARSDSVSFPDATSWIDIADRYRTWIITALWLAATALFVLILRGMARRNRA